MGSLFKTPKAPTFNASSAIQQSNQQNTSNAFQNASFNRINQQDQFGNRLSYAQTGTDAQGNPIFSQNQQLGSTGQMFAGGLANLGQQYFNTAGQGAPDSQGAFDRAYGFASANLEPRFERSRAEMENRLRNQGLDPTSEAFRSASNDLALQQNEARNNLVTGLQGQMFQQGLQSRNQQLNELMPGINNAGTFMQGSYAPVPGVNVQNTDASGLLQQQFQSQMNAFNQQQQQRQAMLGGLASIGGSLIAAPFTGGASLGGLASMGGGRTISNLMGSSGPYAAGLPWAPGA